MAELAAPEGDPPAGTAGTKPGATSPSANAPVRSTPSPGSRAGPGAGRTRNLLRWLAGSVRVRVTTTAVICVGAMLLVAASVLDVRLEHDRRAVLMATAEEQAHEVISFNPRLRTPLVLPADANVSTGLIQVINTKGQVVGASRPLRHLPPLWKTGDPEVENGPEAVGDLARDVRLVAVPVAPNGVTARVVVVTSMAQYDNTVADVHRLLTIGTPMVLIGLALICWLSVRRALRPIELMRREVAAVTGSASHHLRVAEPVTDDEVGRLARTLNSMLASLQASTDRERRFVSDASHELRTPLANIRTDLEVALRHPEGTDWRQIAAEVLEQNERMETLVSGLLLLARSDEGSLISAPDPVDLGRVAADIAEEMPGPAHAGVRVDAGPAPVMVPRVYLERMVTNLVDNAIRFAATEVVVSVRTEAGWAVLAVSDDGPGVPEGERARIFERFVRLDEARGRGAGGFGLGLAIVSDLSRHYGGSIEAVGGPGAVFVLRLPLAERPTTAPAAEPVPAGDEGGTSPAASQPVGQPGEGALCSTDAESSMVPAARASTSVH